MKDNLEELLPLFQCPQCPSSKLSLERNSLQLLCVSCGNSYPETFGRPILIRPDNSIFPINDYLQAGTPVAGSSNGFASFVPSPSVNLSYVRVLARLKQLLSVLAQTRVLVVGGGCQRKWLDDMLGAGERVRVIYCDVDVRADVDIFCDAHNLPFVDGGFEAVITTAVLEHVMYPEKVALEISRVLKIGGILYSELPFMQQVHEGAYDFTRYTLSGHRRLFNRFEEIESGMIAGPGTALVWAIENFILAFLSMSQNRKIAKVIVRFLFSWIKYSDYLLKSRPQAMDGASCTYLLCRKIVGTVSDLQIIKGYVGGKHLQHN
jgi:SAM-dependent methyltransferase